MTRLAVALSMVLSAAALGAAEPTLFVPLSPCRIVDTRFAAQGPLAAGESRSFQVLGETTNFRSQGGESAGCGVPWGAAAVVFNFVAVTPSGPGHLVAWRAAGPQPNASVLNYSAEANIANAVPIEIQPIVCAAGIVPPCAEFNVLAAVSGTDLVIDVYGYFIPIP